ncbi:MAG: putative glycoside hydrolase [bacterium]
MGNGKGNYIKTYRYLISIFLINFFILFFPQIIQKPLLIEKPTSLIRKKPENVKGIHLTSWVVGTQKIFFEIIENIKKSEINSVVIDLKEADGIVSYETKIPLAYEINAVEKRISNLKNIIFICEQNNLYKIARIVVFKDPILSSQKKELSIKTVDGKIWKDETGCSWANPYMKTVWQYNIALAKEALDLGFDEVNFDYVRFPDKGILKNCCYEKNELYKIKDDAILDFVKLASKELRLFGFLSIDVFGVTTTGRDFGIGQNFKKIAEYVDFICPMIYPSHYYENSYNIKVPEKDPYKIIFLSLQDAIKQLKEEKYKIRPWLQNFSLKYDYGENEIFAQIKASYDCDIKEWLFWNPRCKYTWKAFKKTGLNH